MDHFDNHYFLPLISNIVLSFLAYIICGKLIVSLSPLFLNAKIVGKDMHKKETVLIPEAMGIVSGSIYIITMFTFIPMYFYKVLMNETIFPYAPFVEFLAGLLSICCMLLLGFSDDILNLKWRYKLILPTVATLPLLMVYMININSTTVILPQPFKSLIGPTLNLGFFYYIYMGMLAVFCTNSINILAGINGLEVGQSLVISISILIFNFIEFSGEYWKNHLFSINFIMPYIGTSAALYSYNRYPAHLFVGDTFCYYSGMTFAVIAILGHFSKTVLLFFLPQIFNFLFSFLQLMGVIPCPRHRMPLYDAENDVLIQSYTEFSPNQLSKLGHILLYIYQKLGLVSCQNVSTEKDKTILRCSNQTLIILLLKVFGPMREEILCQKLLILQIVGTCIAFVIRYPLANIIY